MLWTKSNASPSSSCYPPIFPSPKLPPTSPTVHPPRPLSAGVLLLPVWFEYDVYAQVELGTFSHKAWAAMDFKKSFFILTCSLCSFTSTIETVSLLKSAGDTMETPPVGTEKQSEKMSVTVWRTGRQTDRQRDKDVILCACWYGYLKGPRYNIARLGFWM